MSHVRWLAAPWREAGRPLLPCLPPALPYRAPQTALGQVSSLVAALASQSALSRGTQAGTHWLWAPVAGSFGPGLPRAQGPGAAGRLAQSLVCFLFSFQIIGISLSQFNIWIFLFKGKGEGLVVVWVCVCLLCFRSRALPREVRPLPLPGDRASICKLSIGLPCLQPLSCFISIFIFMLLLS